jgi:A/G-specific adenine glycosylase
MVSKDRFQDTLLDWGRDQIRSFPWRTPDRSLYEVFIAEFFLTQTPAGNVADVYPKFLAQFPSLDAIRDAAESDLVDVIRPLGFYNMRASALKEIAATHDTLPDEVSDLRQLPRVGEYVANATICFTFGDSLPILDRNVERVYSRIFGDAWPDTRDAQIEFAADLVPDTDARTYNFALLDFGTAVCQPDPNCSVCFASDYCNYYQNELLSEDE